MPNKQRVFIYDWAGNFMNFNPVKGFKTVQDASDFLTEHLRDVLKVSDENLEIEQGEYQYLEGNKEYRTQRLRSYE